MNLSRNQLFYVAAVPVLWHQLHWMNWIYPSHVKKHTCLVKKNISVWNSPLNRTTLKWLDKSTHVWEKPLSICIFTKWQKPNMCGFYQTLTKYKCVWKKPHMFVKNQTCVSFSIQGVVLFVFASVFRICLKDLLHNLPIFHFRGDHAM